MLKYSDLTPEQQSEAFRIADELYQKESEEARHRKAAVDAAEEMGIPAEYLERAAAELHARRVESLDSQRLKKRRLAAMGIGVGVAAGIALMIGLVTPRVSLETPAAAAQTIALASAQSDNVSVSADNTKAQFTFGPVGSGPANVTFSLTGPITSGERLRFTAESDGAVNVRPDVRDGDIRWNATRNVSLAPGTNQVDLPLSEFRFQRRQGNQWVRASGPGVEQAKDLVLKFGQEINPPGTSGTVTIRNLEIR